MRLSHFFIKRPIFAARRVATQVRLAGLHLRRPLDVVLRPVSFDDAEFRAILPIRVDQP